MDSRIVPLDNIRVAAPCKADWRFMFGNDQVRFCGQCNLNVYNLSAMTRQEAEDLIRNVEGRLCVRYYQRADGKIITENCPVGLKAIRKRISQFTTATFAAILGFLANIGLLSVIHRDGFSGTPVMGSAVEVSQPKEGVFETVGVVALPPAVPKVVERTEDYIRDKAIFKVVPLHYLDDRTRIDGSVTVRITISEYGEVIEAKGIKGHPALREVGEDAARRWRFQRELLYDRPVKVESQLTINFKK